MLVLASNKGAHYGLLLVFVHLVAIQIGKQSLICWDETALQHSGHPEIYLWCRSMIHILYLHKPDRAKKMKGSVAITNKLHSIQCKVAISITGGLSSTAGDILDVHAFILPIDLLFCKLLFRAAICLCSLPTHPLHPLLYSASHCNLRQHLSLIHYLLHLVNANSNEIEMIVPFRRSLGYISSFKTFIPLSKEDVLPLMIITNATAPVYIYSDGSGFEGSIEASALLYIKECLVKVL
jgi:hypothetical protein